MTIKTWFKNKPAWLKGGIIALSIYIIVVLIAISTLMISGSFIDKYPDAIQPGSLRYIIPLFVVAIYPGLFLVTSYESMGLAILMNVCFYFIAGAVIGFIASRKPKQSLTDDK